MERKVSAMISRRDSASLRSRLRRKGCDPAHLHLRQAGDLAHTAQDECRDGMGSAGEALERCVPQGIVEKDLVDDQGEFVTQTELLETARARLHRCHDRWDCWGVPARWLGYADRSFARARRSRSTSRSRRRVGRGGDGHLRARRGTRRADSWAAPPAPRLRHRRAGGRDSHIPRWCWWSGRGRRGRPPRHGAA